MFVKKYFEMLYYNNIINNIVCGILLLTYSEWKKNWSFKVYYVYVLRFRCSNWYDQHLFLSYINNYVLTLQWTGERGIAGGRQIRHWHVLLGQGSSQREWRDVCGHRLRVQNQSE